MQVILFAWFIACCSLLVGWVLNILTIINTDTLTFSGLMVMRIIGIFVAPLGGVLGLFF